MRHSFADSARAAHEERIGFDEFVRRTSGRWRWWACRFERRYKLPNWFGREDVEQELLLAAWRAMRRFEEGRGPAPGRFMEWNAAKYTAKVVQKVRGVEQHTRKGPPRIAEVPLPGEDGDTPPPSVPPPQLEELERQERFAQLHAQCEEGVEQWVVEALWEGRSPEIAVRMVYDDVEMRLLLRLGSESDARKLVRHVLAELGDKCGAGETEEEDWS